MRLYTTKQISIATKISERQVRKYAKRWENIGLSRKIAGNWLYSIEIIEYIKKRKLKNCFIRFSKGFYILYSGEKGNGGKIGKSISKQDLIKKAKKLGYQKINFDIHCSGCENLS